MVLGQPLSDYAEVKKIEERGLSGGKIEAMKLSP